MHLFSQTDIIKELNNLGKYRKEFIFIINYQGDEAYILELSDIDPDLILYDFNGVTNCPKGHKNISGADFRSTFFCKFRCQFCFHEKAA